MRWFYFHGQKVIGALKKTWDGVDERYVSAVNGTVIDKPVLELEDEGDVREKETFDILALFTSGLGPHADEAWRGRGFATRLTRAVAAGIRERGETPFLHAAADNLSAIRLYQSLGFRVRRPMPFLVARVPPEKGSG